jgi:uncharacterized protein (TIGR02246 family)
MKSRGSFLWAGVFLTLLLLTVSGCAPKVNDPGAVQAIQKCVDDYAKALIAKDADAIVAQMADDIVYADINIPARIGKEAVKKLHQDFFAPFSAIEFTMPVEDLRVSGDLGVARGTWKADLTPSSEMMPKMRDGGSWMAIFGRQKDGSWKWQAVIANSDQPLPGTSPAGAEETALLQIEQDWAKAFLKLDAPACERFVAKEWTYNSDGQVMNRAQMLTDIKSGAYKIESFVMNDFSAHVFGDAAIVTTIVVMKGTYKGNDLSGRSRSIDYFVKRDGRWQAISTQNTTIKP